MTDPKLNDEFFMREAIRQARRAYDEDEVPVGAVLVWNNEIISKGYNQVELLKDSTAHAEMIALTSAFSALGSKYVPDATLYVTVEPCLMCCGAIYWSKLARIVYGADDVKNGFRRCTGAQSPFHPKTEIVSGFLGQECAALMSEFFRAKRK